MCNKLPFPAILLLKNMNQLIVGLNFSKTEFIQATIWRETLANSLHKHIWRKKIWRICEIIRLKNISEIYSVKQSKRLC